MNEAIAFLKWTGRNGWQPYDGDDRWICLNGTRTVCSTKRLYEKFLADQKAEMISEVRYRSLLEPK